MWIGSSVFPVLMFILSVDARSSDITSLLPYQDSLCFIQSKTAELSWNATVDDFREFTFGISLFGSQNKTITSSLMPDVFFMKDDDDWPSFSFLHKKDERVSVEIEGLVTKEVKVKLTIKNVSKVDDMYYQIKPDDVPSSQQFKWMKVNVTDPPSPPSIKVPFSQHVVGQQIQVNCTIKTVPTCPGHQTIVRLYRNGRIVNQTSQLVKESSYSKASFNVLLIASLNTFTAQMEIDGVFSGFSNVENVTALYPDLKINSVSKEVTVVQGQTAKLHWSLTGFNTNYKRTLRIAKNTKQDRSNASYIFDDIVFINGKAGHSRLLTYSSMYSSGRVYLEIIKHASEVNVTLTLRETTKNDNNVYHGCVSKFTMIMAPIPWIKLNVLDMPGVPSIDITPNHEQSKSGKQVYVECIAETGKTQHPVTMRLFRNGQVIKVTDQVTKEDIDSFAAFKVMLVPGINSFQCQATMMGAFSQLSSTKTVTALDSSFDICAKTCRITTARCLPLNFTDYKFEKCSNSGSITINKENGNTHNVCGKQEQTARMSCKYAKSTNNCNFTIEVYQQISAKTWSGQYKVDLKQSMLPNNSCLYMNLLKAQTEKMLTIAYRYQLFVKTLRVSELWYEGEIVNFQIVIVGNMPDPILPLKETLVANNWTLNGLKVKEDSLSGGFYAPQKGQLKDGLSMGTIALIILAVLFIIISLILILIYCLCCKKRKNKKKIVTLGRHEAECTGPEETLYCAPSESLMLSNEKLKDEPIAVSGDVRNDLLLLWLHHAIPDININNYTSDWNDGIALCAFVEFCQPGLIPDYKSLDPNDKLRNVTVAMRTAEQNLGIPQTMSAEFFASPFVDELSVVTYLTYFTQPGSPGERRCLSILKKQAPDLNVGNFSSDWTSGQALGRYLESRCPGIIPDYDQFDRMTPEQRAERALTVAEEKLNIKKLLTGKEMTNPDVDELLLMSYMLQFYNCKALENLCYDAHYAPLLTDSLCITAEGAGLKRAHSKRTSEFEILGNYGVDRVEAKAIGPDGQTIPVKVENILNGLKCQYTPNQSGVHEVSITHNGVHIPSSPFRVEAVSDVSETMVTGDNLKSALVMIPAKFQINVSRPTSSPVTAVIQGPTRSVPVSVTKQHDVCYLARFTPREVGEHKITVKVGTSVVPGSPFTCKVGDHTKVTFKRKDEHNLQLETPVSFDVNTSDAGLGELDFKCKGPDGGIPVDLHCKSRGRYLVSFTPTSYGVYSITCTFGGKEVPFSPYNLIIEDPSKLATIDEGDYIEGSLQQEVDMTFEIPEGQWKINIFVQCPDDEMMQSSQYHVARETDGHHVKFTPEKPGTYKVHVHLDNEPVDGSPFLLKVLQPKGGGHITTEHTYSQPLTTTEIDFIVKGSADMDDCLFRASVLDPNGRESYCHVSRDVDGKRHVKFQPHCHGQYKVFVYYSEELMRGAPFLINVNDNGHRNNLVEITEVSDIYESVDYMTSKDVPLKRFNSHYHSNRSQKYRMMGESNGDDNPCYDNPEEMFRTTKF